MLGEPEYLCVFKTVYIPVYINRQIYTQKMDRFGVKMGKKEY